jgi:hypothetical protein
MSLREIAEELAKRGYLNERGAMFSPVFDRVNARLTSGVATPQRRTSPAPSDILTITVA